MSVAVVIPAHDSAGFLADAIASVRAQTLDPAEVVVVDDGSTDDTAAVAERLGVRCVRQPNRGPAAARNRGIAETTAPLVGFLDADDRFLPAKLERQRRELERTGAVACATDAWIVEGGRRVATRATRLGGGRSTFEQLLHGNSLVCSSVVVRRDALERAGTFDEDPVLVATEDYDLWLRLAHLGDFAHVDEPLVEYRVHARGLSSSLRFLRGVDRVMDKAAGARGTEERVAELIARRRGRVRADAAYDLARCGEGARARRLLAEARSFAPFGWKECKIWLRSWGPARSRG